MPAGLNTATRIETVSPTRTTRLGLDMWVPVTYMVSFGMAVARGRARFRFRLSPLLQSPCLGPSLLGDARSPPPTQSPPKRWDLLETSGCPRRIRIDANWYGPRWGREAIGE